MKLSPLTITVVRGSGDRSRGILRYGTIAHPVALGRGGIIANKFEGDFGTPRGTFHPVRLWWRADRMPRPKSRLPLRQISKHDAWCEDPTHRRYNQPIVVADGAPGDRLWRDDHLYDLIVEIDHNTRPRVAKRGSAVFLHLAREGLSPTAGCVGMTLVELKRLVARLDTNSVIRIV